MQADQIHKINKNDLVIIQWSSIIREDRYIDKKWITKGGIINHYSEEYIKNYFDMRGFFIRDVAMIKAAKVLLEKIGCEFRFISMCGIGPALNNVLDDGKFELGSDDHDVVAIYKDVLDSIRPSFYSVLGKYANRPLTLKEGVVLHDSHRIPSEHLEYIKQILPEFYPKDIEFVKDADLQLIEMLSISPNAAYPWQGLNNGIQRKIL
jgi:hypothetical protein